MWEQFARLVWFFIVACAIAFIMLFVGGYTIRAQAVDESRIVSVRDSLAPNTHYLSGIVMVRKTCAQLSVRTEKVSETVYSLVFTTWDEPSVPCALEDTPRNFHAVVFAPAAGVHFIGSLDGEPLSIAVYQSLAGRDL